MLDFFSSWRGNGRKNERKTFKFLRILQLLQCGIRLNNQLEHWMTTLGVSHLENKDVSKIKWRLILNSFGFLVDSSGFFYFCGKKMDGIDWLKYQIRSNSITILFMETCGASKPQLKSWKRWMEMSSANSHSFASLRETKDTGGYTSTSSQIHRK